MRVQILSDIHFEFQADHGASFAASPQPVADLLILAGDVLNLRTPKLYPALQALCAQFPKVFYVLGNHEFYGKTPEQAAHKVARLEALIPNLTILSAQKGVQEYLGQRFLGCTLWFPDDPMNAMLARDFYDFKAIKQFVPWVYKQNTIDATFLAEQTQPGDVVITHHLPLHRSVAEQYIGDSWNRFFVSNMEHVFVERVPALWVHGHTHESMDYLVETQGGATRVVCNPFGYVAQRELNPNFKEECIVEI